MTDYFTAGGLLSRLKPIDQPAIDQSIVNGSLVKSIDRIYELMSYSWLFNLQVFSFVCSPVYTLYRGRWMKDKEQME